MDNKTHYRKVFKSDHLGIADLEEFQEEGNKNLIFTIKEVKQEYDAKVAGKKINANIAYFKEDIKPLVLNATNSKVMKSFNNNSPYVEDWSNTIVKLYIDPNVKMKGEVVGGVRINPTQPSLTKPKLTSDGDKWKSAIDFLKGDGKIDQIIAKYDITEEDKEKLISEAI